MTDLATVRDSLEQCYDAIESVCARLDGDEWRTQSLCRTGRLAMSLLISA